MCQPLWGLAGIPPPWVVVGDMAWCGVVRWGPVGWGGGAVWSGACGVRRCGVVREGVVGVETAEGHCGTSPTPLAPATCAIPSGFSVQAPAASSTPPSCCTTPHPHPNTHPTPNPHLGGGQPHCEGPQLAVVPHRTLGGHAQLGHLCVCRGVVWAGVDGVCGVCVRGEWGHFFTYCQVGERRWVRHGEP